METGANIELEARYIRCLVDTTVTATLKSLGLISGWLSTNECRKLYGVEFRRLADAGIIRPVIQGNKKVYNREDIEAALAAELKRARLQIAKASK